MVSNVLPRLNTEFSQSLHFLERHFVAHHEQIENWFKTQWQLTMPPIYGSVDLRNAGFKIAPIDMNLFPAGFNNLNPDFFTLMVTAAKKIISNIASNASQLLVITESHTRNLYYWANIKTLEKIIQSAGYKVRFAMLSGLSERIEISLPTNESIVVYPLERQEDNLYADNFKADLVLLNNDLSEGIPEILKQIRQPIIPPAELGWNQRLKSEHFQYYSEVVNEFAKLVSIDPWLIAPLFRHCGQINFLQQEGLDCLIHNAEVLFASIKEKYEEYQLPYQPFVIVKADAGTYGMAVMTVRSVDDLKNLNRKQRTRMSMTKGGQPVTKVIIQEGVYTFETIGDDHFVAEPVVYLWGEDVVGGFYRVHKERGIDENLNAPGMHFEPIAFSKPCNFPCKEKASDAAQNQFYVYGTIAKLSMLAAAREMKDLLPK